MAFLDALGQRWYVYPNDLIGGWCITNVEKPPSEHNPYTFDEHMVADFVCKEVADHVVDLHNAWLRETGA